MQNLLDICCGLDVHKEVLVACLLKGRLDEEPEPEIREFPTLLNGLDEFKKWIIENNCRHVAMESTGVYWFPIYNVLESILYVNFLRFFPLEPSALHRQLHSSTS